MANFPSSVSSRKAALIVNADDWGRDRSNTDRTLDCVLHGAVSSVSAMLFMDDSERAAGIARERDIDAGLHLNLTTMFSARRTPARLKEHQEKAGKFLRRHRFSPVLFHPGLAPSFEYVVKAQYEEFTRLYGAMPERIDGHHHMHLCANVLWGGMLPRETLVRRNFTFSSQDKGILNRLYRRAVDHKLSRKHPLVDLFFALPPLDPPSRLQKIFSLGREFTVEVETHPVNPEEHRFLTGGEVFKMARETPIAPRFTGAAARACEVSGSEG